MSQNTENEPHAGPAPAGSAPEDRATTFQAVQGEPEHYSGAVLLVSAYAALWLILLAWVALVWRKQAALSTRLADLERVIDETAAGAKGGGGGPAEGAAGEKARR